MTVKLSHCSMRRGQLLLVILAMLTMFTLIAVTLVVITSQARRNATAMARIDQAAEPPRQAPRRGMRQVVRGSNNPGSVIGPHSLLETMYGNKSFTVNVSSAQRCLRRAVDRITTHKRFHFTYAADRRVRGHRAHRLLRRAEQLARGLQPGDGRSADDDFRQRGHAQRP